MNSIQLEYFAAVAECGSFTAASRRLHISQPALSKQLRLLEEELETVLLIRLHHGVQLTPEGRLLYARAENVTAQIRNIPSELNEMHNRISGPLKIVCGPYFSRHFMPDLLKRLLLKYPDICPGIRETLSRYHAEMLLNGAAEIAIGSLTENHPKLISRPLFRSDVVLIRSVRSGLSGKKVTKAELLKQKLISYPEGTRFHEMVNRIFPDEKPAVLMDSLSSATIIELVRQDLGFAFVPDYLITPGQRSEIIAGGYDTGESVTIGCCFPAERKLSPQARAFLEIVDEHFLKGSVPHEGR